MTRHPETTLLAAANPMPPDRFDAFAESFDLDAGLAAAIERGRSGATLAAPVRRLRPALVAVAVGAALLVGVASAFALGHRPSVDFFGAEKAPKSRAFVAFEHQQKVAQLLGRTGGPHIELAAEPRVITDVVYGGHHHVLVVAPTEHGGICASWSGPYLGTTCSPNRKLAAAKPIQAGVGGSGAGPLRVLGWLTEPAADRLEIGYQDGTSEQIPFVWVSPPIDAGFFLHQIPPAHRKPGHYPKSLSLFDADGDLLVTHKLPTGAPRPPLRIGREPGFAPTPIPAGAIYEQRRLLFSVPAGHGLRLGLWVAPMRGGGECLWGAGLSGCRRHPGTTATLPGGPIGQGPVYICCEVDRRVARVELAFEDGETVELRPKRGYLLAAIPQRHYARGHRLDRLTAYDAAGNEIATRDVPTARPGMYPCERRRDFGDGILLCQ